MRWFLVTFALTGSCRCSALMRHARLRATRNNLIAEKRNGDPDEWAAAAEI
jgi:hypothetical protein